MSSSRSKRSKNRNKTATTGTAKASGATQSSAMPVAVPRPIAPKLIPAPAEQAKGRFTVQTGSGRTLLNRSPSSACFSPLPVEISAPLRQLVMQGSSLINIVSSSNTMLAASPHITSSSSSVTLLSVVSEGILSKVIKYCESSTITLSEEVLSFLLDNHDKNYRDILKYLIVNLLLQQKNTYSENMLFLLRHSSAQMFVEIFDYFMDESASLDLALIAVNLLKSDEPNFDEYYDEKWCYIDFDKLNTVIEERNRSDVRGGFLFWAQDLTVNLVTQRIKTYAGSQKEVSDILAKIDVASRCLDWNDAIGQKTIGDLLKLAITHRCDTLILKGLLQHVKVSEHKVAHQAVQFYIDDCTDNQGVSNVYHFEMLLRNENVDTATKTAIAACLGMTRPLLAQFESKRDRLIAAYNLLNTALETNVQLNSKKHQLLDNIESTVTLFNSSVVPIETAELIWRDKQDIGVKIRLLLQSYDNVLNEHRQLQRVNIQLQREIEQLIIEKEELSHQALVSQLEVERDLLEEIEELSPAQLTRIVAEQRIMLLSLGQRVHHMQRQLDELLLPQVQIPIPVTPSARSVEFFARAPNRNGNISTPSWQPHKRLRSGERSNSGTETDSQSEGSSSPTDMINDWMLNEEPPQLPEPPTQVPRRR